MTGEVAALLREADVHRRPQRVLQARDAASIVCAFTILRAIEPWIVAVAMAVPALLLWAVVR